jgi:hypothetical protein
MGNRVLFGQIVMFVVAALLFVVVIVSATNQ